MLPGEFRMNVTGRDGRYEAALEGELDLSTAGEVEAMTRRLCEEGAREIVLDLGALDFIDSTGLRSILLSLQLCREHRCELWLTPAHAQVQRLFELAGALERLPFRDPERADAPSGETGGAVD